MSKFLVVLILISLCCIICSDVWGQTGSTGELSGEIKSYETEESLPGATIALKGTDYRTISDQEGIFVLKNIPAGTYRIEVSLIGYLKTTRSGMEVKSGEKTSLLIKLRSSPIFLEKGVQVVGEKPLLDIKLPASKREISSQELELVPATDLKEIISQQVGVIQDRNELHIRGGRSYENLFYIDDLRINDPFSRSGYGFAISPNALQKLDLTTGGLDARYGQVTSGVTEMELKEGSEKPEGSLTYKTDDLGFKSSSNFHTGICDLNLSGPAGFLKSGFTKTGLNLPGNFFFFFNGDVELSDTYLEHTNKLYSSSFGKTRFAPREDNRYSGIFKLTWKDPSFKCSLVLGKSVVINQDKSILTTRISPATYSFGPPFEYSKILDHYDTFTQESNFQLLSFQKIIEEKHLLSASFSRYFTNLHADVNGKTWSSYSMPVDAYPFEIEISPDSTHYIIVKSPDGFYDQGDGDTWYDHFIETYGANLKLTTVVNDLYTIRTGISEEYQTIQLLDIYKPWLGTSGFGLSYDLYKVYANDGSVYWENILKLDKATLDLGLRYDYWFPGEFVERAMEDTTLSFISPSMRKDFKNKTFELLGHRGKGNLSPRFGFSAPIARNSSFFFDYARLSRKPNPQYLYAQLYSSAETVYQLRGNPNLNSERVISYETGIKSMLTDNDALSLVGYYRSIYDYITAARIVPDTLRPESAYLIYFNLDFATSRGVEIEYKRKVKDYFSASLQVGCSKTTGERSDPEDILKGIGGRSAQQIYQEHIFDWDKPWQAVLKTVLFSKDERLRLFGWKLPPQWDLSITFWAQAGKRYTPYKQSISTEGKVSYIQAGDINSKIGRYWSGLDLGLRKHFLWKSVQYSLILEVTNLFDHKNVVIINPLTGDAYKNGDVIPYGDGDPNLPDKSIKTPLWSDPSRYLAPRNIKLGISINW